MNHTVYETVPESVVQAGCVGDNYSRWGKRVLDILAVVLVLPIAIPLIFLAWLLTKTDGGTGFYSQARIGRDGRVFRCWKIRTMIPDAEQVLANLMAGDETLAREWQKAQKLSDDPRITPLGRVLRKTSVDELPQLWNVLAGDMSLIGPRPFMPGQKHIYDRSSPDPAYYRMRPGITGLWQVECRNNGFFTDRVSFDERYLGMLTLRTDIGIALKTMKVVFQANGR